MGYCLSTKDNPFSPFTDFKDWYYYDMLKGYNSSGLLMRVAKTSKGLTDEENDRIVENAIDFIIKFDPTGMYIKVGEDYTPPGGS